MGLIRFALFAFLVALVSALGACNREPVQPIPAEYDPGDPNRPTVFGPGGLDFFGGKKRDDEGGGGIGPKTALKLKDSGAVGFAGIGAILSPPAAKAAIKRGTGRG